MARRRSMFGKGFRRPPKCGKAKVTARRVRGSKRYCVSVRGRDGAPGQFGCFKRESDAKAAARRRTCPV